MLEKIRTVSKVIKNLFPYQTSTLEKFVTVMKAERCLKIIVTPSIRGNAPADSIVQGFVVFSAKTLTGRKIVHRINLFEHFQTNQNNCFRLNIFDAYLLLVTLSRLKIQEVRQHLPELYVKENLDGTYLLKPESNVLTIPKTITS